MKKEDARERARAINKIAQVQTLSGRLLVIGEGMVASNIVQSPYRIFDNCPVYHSCVNEFDLSELEFERRKVHKWGEFYHPCLMFGSPSIDIYLVISADSC
jgi:hypothetical protein